MKKSLIGKNLDEFSDLCSELGVENFRSKQLFNWMYRNEVSDLAELKNLPKSLIDDLRIGHCIHPLELINSTNSSSEKTNKFLFKTTCIKKVVAIPRKIPVIKSLVSVTISVIIKIAACSLPIFRILRKLLGAASLYPV